MRQRGRGDREKVTDEERRKVTWDLRSVDVSQYTTERMDNGVGGKRLHRESFDFTAYRASIAVSEDECPQI